MSLLSELVKVIAKVEGMDEVSVGIFARHAREAGLISQGGRGRAGAKMNVRDAANLLIAVNACALAKDVPAGVPTYRALRVGKHENPSELDVCKPGASFGDDLETLIKWCMQPEKAPPLASIPPGAVIRFERPIPRAQMRIYFYVEANLLAPQHAYYGPIHKFKEAGKGDRSDETVFSIRTLNAVAAALNA